MPNQFIQDPTLPQGFSITFIDRFWSKVDKNGPIPAHKPELGPCWIWTARIATSGYGEMQRGARGTGIINAHVASWIIHNGLPPEGLCVLHRCDNRPCCNPAHLFTGTYADNSHDMWEKGRGNPPSGERHRDAKLTWDKVIAARALHASGQMTIAALARMYSMDRGQMCRVIHGDCWKTPPE